MEENPYQAPRALPDNERTEAKSRLDVAMQPPSWFLITWYRLWGACTIGAVLFLVAYVVSRFVSLVR